jgi:uncharacterized RDD family membrane protein YckC
MDTLVAGGIAFFPALIVSETFGDQPDAATILFMLLFFAYQPFFEIRSQASPVMRVFGMRVVTEAGDRPSKLSLVFRSILRPIGPILLVSMIWPITFLVLARSPWTHDFLTGTRIIIAHKSQG